MSGPRGGEGASRDQDAPGAEAPPAESSPVAGARHWRDALIALRVRNFRLFWFGQLVSGSGTWMQTVAQAWLVLSLSRSPLVLSTVVALQFLPMLAFALVGGVVADRLPKRRLLLATNSVAALQALALGLLVSGGEARLWHVYALALLLGLTNAFNGPAQQAFVPEMVGRELVPQAVALNSVQFNAARMIGPALGGLAIATLGLAEAFYLNAASYLPAILALAAIRTRELRVQHGRPPGSAFAQLREGLSYVRRTPALLLVVLLLAAIGTFGFNWQTLIPLLARNTFGLDATGLGVLMSAMGLGTLGASLALAYSPHASESRLLAAAGALGAALVLLGLSPWYGVSVIVVGLGGFAGIVFMITANTRLQTLSPDRLRGRVMSLFVLLMGGSTPVGALLFGVSAHWLGVRGAVTLFGGLCLGAAALATRRRERAPSDEPLAAASSR